VASKVSQTQADSSPVSHAQNCHVERPRGDPPMDCLEPEWSTETVLETRTGRDGVDPFSYGDLAGTVYALVHRVREERSWA